MRNILLVNQEFIPHYRVPIYGYLHQFLDKSGYRLTIVANGIQKDNPYEVRFPYKEMKISTLNLMRLVSSESMDCVIFWVNLKYRYLFPSILVLRFIMWKKIIYWGHGKDLEDPDSLIKNIGYFLQHALSHSIILYAGHLRASIHSRMYSKTYIANNTLLLPDSLPEPEESKNARMRYGINTDKNIIFIGVIQKRKRIDDLISAFQDIRREDTGLIVVGPDPYNLIGKIDDVRIYKIGPVYGPDRLALLSAADIFCIPGHVGLGIVDAFWCGLPLVTEDIRHAPEIMYLKNGVNGFTVPEGNIEELRKRLEQLLCDNDLYEKFSNAAREEILTNGHIDKMCAGFADALNHVYR